MNADRISELEGEVSRLRREREDILAYLREGGGSYSVGIYAAEGIERGEHLRQSEDPALGVDGDA